MVFVVHVIGFVNVGMRVLLNDLHAKIVNWRFRHIRVHQNVLKAEREIGYVVSFIENVDFVSNIGT